MKVTHDAKRNVLTIEVPCQEPRPSSTGKTLLVASETAAYGVVTIAGKPVKVAVNAYVKP